MAWPINILPPGSLLSFPIHSLMSESLEALEPILRSTYDVEGTWTLKLEHLQWTMSKLEIKFYCAKSLRFWNLSVAVTSITLIHNVGLWKIVKHPLYWLKEGSVQLNVWLGSLVACHVHLCHHLFLRMTSSCLEIKYLQRRSLLLEAWVLWFLKKSGVVMH